MTIQNFKLLIAVCVSVYSLGLTPAVAHEMWIEPLQYQWEKSSELNAEMKVGQEFKGFSQRYNPNEFIKLDMVFDGQAKEIDGRLGDRPAIKMQSMGDGLHVMAHESAVLTTSYSDLEKFAAFLDHKDLGWALAMHRERGLQETDFREAYSRFAKSLIAVGDGAGADIVTGLTTEFVALANPYTDNISDGIAFQLRLFDAPWPDQQVEVFERSAVSEKADRIFLLRTDDTGRVTVPIKPGHSYLLDAVHMRPPSDALAVKTNAVWETLWASMTFAVPQ